VVKLRIKAEHAPIDPLELAEHEMEYLFSKEENDKRRSFEMKLMNGRESREYYKGKYRSLVLEDIVEKRAK
jgi:hypothetical protein